jgi:integrase
MSRRGENIFKRKDGRWEGRYMVGRKEDGRIKYHSVYASSYSECSKKLKAALVSEHPPNNSMTVAQLFEAWLLNRKNSIKQSTFVSYRTRYESYVSKIGDYQVADVTSTMLDQLIDDLISNGSKKSNNLSPETVQAVIILIRSIFKYAEKEFKIQNPADGLMTPQKEPKEVEIFTDEEISRIKNATITNDSMYLGIALALFTGIRIGELCALK